MMGPDPMRTAMTKLGLDDTSLAVPSDNKLRSGQQRVLDQVHTIKRSKSKHGGKNGTLSPSPTSMSPTASYEFGTFKFSPSKANGTVSRMSSTLSTGYSKGFNAQKSRTLSTKSMGRQHFSTSGTWEKQINTATWPKGPNGLKPSRSDPALAPAFLPVPTSGTSMRGKGVSVQNQQTYQSQVNRHSTYSMTNGSQMTNSQTRIIQRPSSSQFQVDGKMGTFKGSKIEQQSQVNTGVTDMSLREAVEYLSRPDESFQQCGATFIQHITFKEEQTKQEVYKLGGIPALVTLLESSNPGVTQGAAGALRNLVFQHHDNKMEVQHCSGISKALRLLKETDCTETQKQITGLLWNLSAADELKQELIATALPALTENVVVPFTCWSDNSANNNIHPDVFYNATGCLRNLSAAKEKERQTMRQCRGLIDSLMSYIQSCVAEENPDDKSVENCTCILHNLTYELEDECPECFSKYRPQTSGSPKSPVIGCFNPRSQKAQNEFQFDAAQCQVPDESTPTGVKWLCHPKAMQTYMSLLGTSKKDATLEASCGALQNLTAGKGLGSRVMSQILVEKLGALLLIPSLLKSPSQKLQKTAMSLLGNMSRASSLHSTMAKELLPELTGFICSGPKQMGNSDNTIATACNTLRTLMLSNSETSKNFLNHEVVSSLTDLSENGSFPKGRQAASLLLYSLWNDKNLQGAVKKLGISKSAFVNANTMAVHRLAQVID